MFKIGGSNKYIGFAVSFGITMAITVYILYKGGQWLDAKLGTAPVFTMLGVLMGVAAVFKRLIADLKVMEKMDKFHDDPE